MGVNLPTGNQDFCSPESWAFEKAEPRKGISKDSADSPPFEISCFISMYQRLQSVVKSSKNFQKSLYEIIIDLLGATNLVSPIWSLTLDTRKGTLLTLYRVMHRI